MVGDGIGIHGPNAFAQEGFILVGYADFGQLTIDVLVEDCLLFGCVFVGKLYLII